MTPPAATYANGSSSRRPRGSRVILDRIARSVADEFGLPDASFGRSRRRPMVAARHEFMRRAYETGSFSTLTIGRFLGLDHTTVLYGLRMARERSAV